MGVFQNGRGAGADGSRSFQEPVLNDEGTAAFETSFFDENGQFLTAIVTSDGGPLTTVVDTNGQFGFFGFRPPSINDGGQVAFQGILDDFQTTGIFVGPDAVADRVVATGDQLDGASVSSLSFEEGAERWGRHVHRDPGRGGRVADRGVPGQPSGLDLHEGFDALHDG